MEWDKIISALIMVIFSSTISGYVVYNLCGWLSCEDTNKMPVWMKD